MLEDFLNGALKGCSFNGNVNCEAAMSGCVYYAFDAINNRDVTNPSKIIKLGIAAQKLQEQATLFSA
jgi:hypothetical protein